MWQRVLALVVKELLALFKDARTRVVITIPPLIQVLVFSYAATLDLNHVPLAVFDQDGGPEARELIAEFTGSPSFHEVARLHHQSEIRDFIDPRRVLLVLRIPSDYGRHLHAGDGAPVQLIVDGRNSNTAMIALNYARDIIQDYNLAWAATSAAGGPPARLVPQAWFNPNLESRWFIVPGIVGLLTLLVTMVVTSLSIAAEREQGTFDQLLVTPLRPLEILLGKTLPGLLIGLAEASLITLIAVAWFGIPLRGELTTLYTGLLLFIPAAIGIGLMISSLAATLQQALLGTFLFMVPAVILSGFATPIENMPWAVQLITYADPLRYLLVILRGVFLEGASLAGLWPQLWPMALIAAICLSFSAWLFRHRMY